MRRVILYHQCATWEIDYVQHELLRDQQSSFAVRFLNTEGFISYTSTEHTHMIIVFSSNLMTMDQLRPIVKRLKPQVIIHLSDEDGTKPEFCELSDLAPLILRQHRFAAYASKPNIFQIPLGYMTGFPTNLPLVPIDERDLEWAFIGTIKKDGGRRKMLDAFARSFPKDKFVMRTEGGVNVAQMASIYSKAKFVPNDRGDVRLDCFRLYEAVMVGAIPVTVGTKEELEETFFFEGKDDMPPFVFANSWEDAIRTCRELLTTVEALQTLQRKNIAWLQAHFDLARRRISTALKDI